jgi:endonuclease-3
MERTEKSRGQADNKERQGRAERTHALLLTEYGERQWYSRADPLSELVQTILSQHTSDVNSHRAFAELRATFPTWEAARDAPIERVATTIRSAGLGNIKAPRIQQVLREVSQNGRLDLGFLRDMPLAEAKTWLRSLSGVGPKTAACVLLFSLGKPALPVDTHVFRVSRRLGLIGPKVSADQAHDDLEAMLPPEALYAFHVNVVAHGRQVCHAQRPACERCVLQSECDYFLQGMGTSPHTPSADKPTN